MCKTCCHLQFSLLGWSRGQKKLDGSYSGLTEIIIGGTFQASFESTIHAAQLSLSAREYLQKHKLDLILLLCAGPLISIALLLNIWLGLHTPNGIISYISDSYRGRASDIFTVYSSRLLNLLLSDDKLWQAEGSKYNTF